MRILLLLFVLSLNSALSEDCSRYTKITFEEWKMGEFRPGAREFKPEQFLPLDYLQKLEKSFGKIVVETFQSGDKGLKFRVKSLLNPELVIMRWELIDEGIENSLQVENLRVSNPLNNRNNLRYSQDNKGLPANVFRYARDQLFELVRKSGNNKIYAKYSENYTVVLLYIKIVGMKPIDPKAPKVLKMLEQYYASARKHFPIEYRPKSLNDFALSLGPGKFPGGDPKAHKLWEKYLKTGKMSKKLELLYDEKGSAIAFAFAEAAEGQPKVYFIDRYGSEEKLLQLSSYDFALYKEL